MKESDFTQAQKYAIESTGESIAVTAGAGSGKTMVLIERCRRIIDETGGGLDRILAITFTEKAAAELSAKLRPHLKPELLPRLASAWIGTFHSFCARVLRANAPAAGLDPSFKILDENGARLAASRSVEESFLDLLDRGSQFAALLVEELEYKNAIGVLEDLMSFRWHAGRLFEMMPPAEEREAALISAAAHCFAAAKALFEASLRQKNSLDFQEIEIATLSLLKDNPVILSSYRKKFRHILVDEYQDTNDIQTELVKLLFDPAANRLFIVGDPRQSIYRFRGANVGCFAAMQAHILKSKGRAIYLSENFRSRPAIIDFVNRASRPLEKSLFENGANSALKASRPASDFPSVTALVCHSGEDSNANELRSFEAEAIAEHIERLLERKEAACGDIVCLFQAVTATQSYEAALCRRGIPFRVYGGRHLLDRPEITDLVAALNYAADPENDTALITLARSPLVGLSDDELVILAGEKGKSFREEIARHPKAGLLSLLKGAGVHLRPSEILSLVLDETGYEVFSAEIDPSGGRISNIDRLFTLAESLERESPVSLSAFVEFISKLRDESARLGDPPAASDTSRLVRLMTVHAAKGLEFPVVFLPDLIRQPVNRGGSWVFARGAGLGFKWRNHDAPYGPMIESQNYRAMLDLDAREDEAERLRLLYVAMTRAKDKLIFPVHERDKSAWRWQNWLKPMVDGDVEKIDQNCLSSPSALVGDPVSFKTDWIPAYTRGNDKPLGNSKRTFTVSELESFARCPQEYYLKHVAGLPAAMIPAKRQSGIPANVRGSIIHGVLEKIDPKNADDISNLIAAECIAKQIEASPAEINKLARPLKTFSKTPLFAELSNGQRELAFDWNFDGHIIGGKIDWLKISGTRREIVDFKTDRIAADCVAARSEDYLLQMTCYALAAEAALGSAVASATLYFLDPGAPFVIEINDKRRQSGLKEIGSIIGRIISADYEIGGAVLPCARKNCTCPYHLNGLCWLDRAKKK